MHPLLGTKDRKTQVKKFINFLQYSNGTNEISDISKLIKVDIKECYKIYHWYGHDEKAKYHANKYLELVPDDNEFKNLLEKRKK